VYGQTTATDLEKTVQKRIIFLTLAWIVRTMYVQSDQPPAGVSPMSLFRIYGNSGPHATYSYVVQADTLQAATDFAKCRLHVACITSVEPVATVTKAEQQATIKREFAVRKALAAIAY
jgi:hypothetical protein